LRTFAFGADLERQADDRVIDARTHRLVQAMADPHQDAAPDGVNNALGGVQPRNQKEQGDQRRHAAAGQNAIVDFQHEQRAGEHQKIAHAAEGGGRDKGSPARAERGGKFRTHGLLLRPGGVVHLTLRTIS
jgi:hypothetical protein